MGRQPKVEIYTWDNCPFCNKTLALLDSKKVKYVRYRIDGDNEAKEKMSLRADGRTSVPQVFINDKHIGGCDDIHSLDMSSELDKLLELNNQ